MHCKISECFLVFFFLSPHIPTDIIADWSVQKTNAPHIFIFRKIHFGELLKKSTHGHQSHLCNDTYIINMVESVYLPRLQYAVANNIVFIVEGNGVDCKPPSL